MSNEKIAEIFNELESTHLLAGPIYQSLQRFKTLHNKKNEIESIYNLSESHCPGLRLKTVQLYEKLQSKEMEINQSYPLHSSKQALTMKCPKQLIESNMKEMFKHIEEMPSEWTIVQLTPGYNKNEEFNVDYNTYYTNSIHISVFKCGTKQPKPFLVTVDAPSDPVNGKPVELVKEMVDIIIENKETLLSRSHQRSFTSQKDKFFYFSRRQAIEDRIRNIITDIQNMWLREWRCLLTGKFCDQNLEGKIHKEIVRFFKEEMPSLNIYEKTEIMLTSVVKCYHQLKLLEVKQAVQYCFPNVLDKKIIINIVQFLRKLGDKIFSKGAHTRKHPVILVIHETLDFFPWEMIDVLQDESVTRLPSLHFVYALFKEHEYEIVDGYKIIRNYDKGTYIVNPDRDLKNMEIRMTTFFNYWTPNWTGTAGYQPEKEDYLEILTSCEIFSYNGHGSGSRYFSVSKLQQKHVKAVVLLFGCGSNKIVRYDPQVEMFGFYHMYLIARCPCVVGMLWEVTDTDTDVLTADFISNWIPSKAPIHWKYVDKTKWKKAEDDVVFVKNTDAAGEDNIWEPELSRALCRAKKVSSCLNIKAACVVRGIPVRIQKNS